jgi:hypothetical protein
MNKERMIQIASLLSVIGLLLILAGPAFHFIDSKSGLYAGLACWLFSGTLAGLAQKKTSNDE